MEAVTARAEEVIRLTQPTFMLKDRSSIGRSQNVFIRLLTKYTSQRNKNYNAIRRAILEYDIGKKTKKDKTRLLYKLAIITVISSLMIMGIDELRNLLYRRKNQGIISRIIKVFGNTLSFAYGIGDIFSSLISKVERGTYGGWDMSNPVSSFADNALDGMADLMRAVKQASSDERYKSGTKKGEAKWKTSALRGADQAIDTIAKFKGIPYATIKKLIQIPFRYAEDEEPTKTTGRPKPPKLPTPPRPPRP